MAAEFRISGLVRLAHRVTAELAQPISAARRTVVRRFVAEQLNQVEALLKHNGSSERQLPVPSRRAIAELRLVLKTRWSEQSDVGRLQPAQGELWAGSAAAPPARPVPDVPPASAEAPPSLSRSGARRFSSPALSRSMERSLRRLAEPLSDAQAEQLRSSIEKTSRWVESSISSQGLSHAELIASFRDQRGWMAMMSKPDRMAQYRVAQTLCRKALRRVDSRRRLGAAPAIEFRPMRGLYRFRTRPGGAVVQLAMPMMAMDAPFFDALACMMLERTPQARQQVLQAVDTAAYQKFRIECESLGGRVDAEPGKFHDLSASFERVNAAFFNGTMKPPRLIWSRSSTHRIMGYYKRTSDVLMISRTLDRPDVEPFVLDFLMYHELLHKKHGTRWSSGRGYVHTPEFYADEHRFPRHAEADQRLKWLARAAASA